MAKNKNKDRDAEKARRRWVVLITIAAFLLSVFMSMFSDMLLSKSSILVAFIILIVIIFIGILFDILGVAVTVADEKPFHSMAAGKIRGAKSALMLLKNASRVSNLFNDVVGDTCGIISGSASAFIVTQIASAGFADAAICSVILSGFVASMTIGGKAVGKEIAISRSKEIINGVSKFIAIFAEHGTKRKKKDKNS